MPVIPATWEAEAGENRLNLGGGGCGEPRSRHCTLAWVTRAKLRLKKKKKMKDAEKSAKEDKDPMNKSGARSKRRSGPKAKFGTSSITVLFVIGSYDKLFKEDTNYKLITQLWSLRD